MSKENGELKGCAVADEWQRYRDEIRVTMEQINDTHIVMSNMIEHVKHLSKLDGILSAIGGVEAALIGFKDGLLGPATSKNQIGNDTFELIMTHTQKNTRVVYCILGAVIVVLLFVIGFLLTGEKLDWIRKLVGAV